MSDKLKMHTPNKADENFKKLAALFPNAVTETIDEFGEVVRAIDKDILMQEISTTVVEGKDERYQFTWPDKKKSILLANAPINKTLRPCREESVNFDTTENLYIEGDNLEVLKLLQETYLGKIKMIYIDPPYNTGNDFIYEDDFAQSTEEYLNNSGQLDESGNRLVHNTENNGRFHTDWLNMIYPRLKVAKDLLSDDGIICISMDDNEYTNLKKLCSEVFGDKNFVGEIIRKTKSMTADNLNGFNLQHEVLVIYAKNIEKVLLLGEEKSFANYSNPDNDPNGDWCTADPSAKSGGNTTYFPIENPYTHKIDYPPVGRFWAFSKSTLASYIKSGRITFKKEHGENERGFIFKRYKNNMSNTCEPVNSLFAIENDYMNQSATIETKNLMEGNFFSYPKPLNFIKKIIKYANTDIVLDFFSGSSTTAHAVMQLNAEDNGNRKFIMVQLPEETDEKSEAYKAGYKNICEIGKERIRRAGNQIKQQILGSAATSLLVAISDKNMDTEMNEYAEEKLEMAHNIDIGFRVLKCDSSNMKDVYYNPQDIEISLFNDLIDNIKEDRTPEDLLFQVMLDLGVLLSSKIEETTISGKKVFNVAEGFLIACFDADITEEVVTEIAKQKPYYFVTRDNSMADDNVANNFEQIFATYSPDTVRKVL